MEHLSKELISDELKLEIIDLYENLNEIDNELQFINFNLIKEKLINLSFGFFNIKKSFLWIDLYDEADNINESFINIKTIEMNIFNHSLDDVKKLLKMLHNTIYNILYKYGIN